MPEAQPLLPIPLRLRAERETTDILGAGGYLEISRQEHPSSESSYDQPKTLNKLEVNRWMIRPKYHTVEVPCSGSFGAVDKRRLASDFKFVAELSWDVAGLIETGEPQEAHYESPFLDDRVQGYAATHFHVGIVFALGDPAQYDRLFPDADQVGLGDFYYCPRVEIDDLTITNPILKPDIIRGVVRGSGAAALRRYHRGEWVSAGGFNFTKTIQEHGGTVPPPH